MSLGTRNFQEFPKISSAINAMPNTIIVAACNNNNTITYPACLTNVIGVRHCDLPNLSEKFAYLPNAYDNIDVLTCVPDGSNSMAAPVIAAHICNYLSDGIKGIDAIRQKLKENAIQDNSFADYNFYRSLLNNWRRINVPIISLPEHIPGGINKVKELMESYINEGFKAACLSNEWDTSAEHYVFNLSLQNEYLQSRPLQSMDVPHKDIPLPDLIELYYNYTDPTILFLHMDQNKAEKLPPSVSPNIFIGEDWIKADVQSLYDKIAELLNELFSNDKITDIAS